MFSFSNDDTLCDSHDIYFQWYLNKRIEKHTVRFNYLCEIFIRDFEIAVCLWSPRKTNFNLVTFLVGEVPEKTGFNYS